MHPEVMNVKLGDKLRAKAVIRQVAEQQGLSTAEVRREMQLALDEAWATADHGAQQRQHELFPDGKPSLEQFIMTLAGELRSSEG